MKVSKLYEDAKLPTRKNSNDAGLDLYSLHYCMVAPNNEYVINTGATVEIPEGCFGFIHAKSKSNFLIGGGIVDRGYTGELLIKVVNYHDLPLTISKHEAIAQLVIIPCLLPEVEEVSKEEIHKEKTERGATGGIVTGFVKQLEITEAIHSTSLDRDDKYGTRYAGQE